MESEAGDFFWPNMGWDNEIVSTSARADSTLRLLFTRTPFTLWLDSKPGRKEIMPQIHTDEHRIRSVFICVNLWQNFRHASHSSFANRRAGGVGSGRSAGA